MSRTPYRDTGRTTAVGRAMPSARLRKQSEGDWSFSMFTTLAAMAISATSAQKPAAGAAPAPAPQQATKTAQRSGYTCPLTGEELPCPNCCPVRK